MWHDESMKNLDADRERVKTWMANGGLADPIETLAAEFGKLRDELEAAHQPANCLNCGKRVFFGARIGGKDRAFWCDFSCAEEDGEEWAQK